MQPGRPLLQACTDTKEELDRAISKWKDSVTADMEEFSCEESLDCLEAIYKVITRLLATSHITYNFPLYLTSSIY